MDWGLQVSVRKVECEVSSMMEIDVGEHYESTCRVERWLICDPKMPASLLLIVDIVVFKHNESTHAAHSPPFLTTRKFSHVLRHGPRTTGPTSAPTSPLIAHVWLRAGLVEPF